MSSAGQNSIFFYEHLGHMQFSVLTLKTYETVHGLADGKANVYVDWDCARGMIERAGFSRHQAESEMQRFCYGYECIDRFSPQSAREIALTTTGIGFLDGLLAESGYQESEITFLVRLARRPGHYNVTIQESTFFRPVVYETISSFGFRAGGAREFLRTISERELLVFLNSTCQLLSQTHSTGEPSLEKIIAMVQERGKYWASVGSRYSWFVFPQKFELAFDDTDWSMYDRLIESATRPPEWGGGVCVAYESLLALLQNRDRLWRFRNSGIVRPVWKSTVFEEADFCLTSPGYLMWERKRKGFLYELRVRRLSETSFQLSACTASDLPKHTLETMRSFATDAVAPTFRLSGDSDGVCSAVSDLLRSSRSQSVPLPIGVAQ